MDSRLFNPNFLDASIRDVTSLLTNNQKADLLLYVLRSLPIDSARSKCIIENAIESCLQLSTLTPENVAKARIIRAKHRFAIGADIAAQQDLQAALVAEPDNPEAKALLHRRSVAVEKLLSPLPRHKSFSAEIWREIASFVSRRDLKVLLFVPGHVSRVASQALFRKVDLHLSDSEDEEEILNNNGPPPSQKYGPSIHGQRSADILTRIITDTAFACIVRRLRIFSARGPYPVRDNAQGSLAFQIGMLSNAFPNLINLRYVHISAGYDALLPILRTLQSSGCRLRGLSINSMDGPLDLSSLHFEHLNEISYSFLPPAKPEHHLTNPTSNYELVTSDFFMRNRMSLRCLTLDTRFWTFPVRALSIRNLTHISFSGLFPHDSRVFADILSNGRQLASLNLKCRFDEFGSPSVQFRDLKTSLPFLRHFSFTVYQVNGTTTALDRDLFPAIAEFLRHRSELRTLTLILPDDPQLQRALGFGAETWGVLPSLTGLRGLLMSYPDDLAPGLAGWLVPRSVESLGLEGTLFDWGENGAPDRSMIPFFEQMHMGIPNTLRLIGLSGSPSSKGSSPDASLLRVIPMLVEHGFPSVRVVRIGNDFFTVNRVDGLPPVTQWPWEIEQWPKRRVLYHLPEWMEWYGCEATLGYGADRNF
ncbi:hypothetical protein FISHEDRAFT_33079 [Fistulina hepatica ATCC 64428]|uniref:Uncharacterized protein n=1 Tax=Fistulina hepatica ATCC 64428 TaxID=1128425 RepID=A0A0D7AQF3_9AGAR|nr:hypothetical protein FISHEDRAFT_33079 [Fistulina hepatica ATCC 64428]